MSAIKQFAIEAITSKPKRYGVDDGDLNLINDYFESHKWQPLTREQHTAIAGLIRRRNDFLQENKAYDHRSKKTSYEHIGQTSIYDFMSKDTDRQTRKLIRYWTTDSTRVNQSNSRIKKSVRGVDDEHIIAAKVYHPLLKANPKLKQKRRQQKVSKDGCANGAFDDVEETNNEY